MLNKKNELSRKDAKNAEKKIIDDFFIALLIFNCQSRTLEKLCSIFTLSPQRRKNYSNFFVEILCVFASLRANKLLRNLSY